MVNTLSAIVIVTALLNPSVTHHGGDVISESTYSLSNRYEDPFVNEVFSDNILLTLAYLNGSVKKGDDIEWNEVRSPQETTFTLEPGHTFAFHDTVLDKYKDSITLTTNAHFISSEGFRSSGWLVGDGVCHLASFMYVVAKEAGLQVEAPTGHDFAAIPDILKKDGVSIYYSPNNATTSQLQNLYITNNQEKPVVLVFAHDAGSLDIQVRQLN